MQQRQILAAHSQRNVIHALLPHPNWLIGWFRTADIVVILMGNG